MPREKSRLGQLETPALGIPDADSVESLVPENTDLFEAGAKALRNMKLVIDEGFAAVEKGLSAAKSELVIISAAWQERFESFKSELDEELEKIDPGASLTSLRASLEQLQVKLTAAQASLAELEHEALPDLTALELEREELLSALNDARSERRRLRRYRVADLNEKMAGFVKLDIPSHGDDTEFREALDRIKVGSRVKDDFLNQLSLRTHPLKFARSMWTERIADLVNEDTGIDMTSLAKLLGNIDERQLWPDLLEIQGIDRPDRLVINFRKPDEDGYTAIEELAHGQRCTAILVILLADGESPVLVDQPEDALHAPWIEEYLVNCLRNLRGSRQYLFATRSPGIVVSGDAEQIITMGATAGHGQVEACGSLERYDLNKLALHHLEGGRIPFKRRTRKLITAGEAELTIDLRSSAAIHDAAV